MEKNIGFIFDWDGVIIDSSSQHEESWERLAREEGYKLQDGHFKLGFGRKNEYIIPNLLGWTKDESEIDRLSLKKEKLYRDIIEEKGINPINEVEPFLQLLKENDIPCVIGSSTHRLNIETALRHLGFGQYFVEIVSAEDVNQGKPHPEVFLLAAKKLGLSPENCLVVEDAMVGIEAAHAGGIKAIAVTNTHPAEKLKAADKIVSKLSEIAIDDILILIGK